MNWFQSLKRQLAAPATSQANVWRVARAALAGKARAQRYIVMPRRVRARSQATRRVMLAMYEKLSTRYELDVGSLAANVLDSVRADGPKLVEMSQESAKKLLADAPGLLVVPEVFYAPAVHLVLPKARATKAARKTGKKKAVRRMTISVRGSDDAPIAGAGIALFSDLAARAGVDGTTDAAGRFTFSTAGFSKIELVLVYPEKTYWSAMKRNVALGDSAVIRSQRIDLGYTDCVRHFYGRGADGDGSSVRVGVVDSGVALDHPDLKVAGGACTIPGEDPASFGALGGRHGSHVAGIIAARGVAPSGLRGIAPAVELRSYRVFNAGEGASNFSIVRAIDTAVADGCDLINLSLGGGPRDAATEAAIEDARARGAVCIVAAGNDYRSRVSQPAAFGLCVAVSAAGRVGTFPRSAADTLDIASPHGTEKEDFLAAFSNVGPEIDATGPGVGVISTVPGGYAELSGTSMACPAVTGAAARLLARPAHQAILRAPRDRDRADAITRMLLQACRPLGFGYNNEGNGLPRP
jgi:subtilisin